MKPNEVKAVKMALWAFDKVRKQYAFDANLYKMGVETTPNAQRSAEVVENLEQAAQVFRGWLELETR